MRERGITGSELPVRGALAVTVPGTAALWEDTIKAFGKLPLAEARPIIGAGFKAVKMPAVGLAPGALGGQPQGVWQAAVGRRGGA